jgi:hypothetical protein
MIETYFTLDEFRFPWDDGALPGFVLDDIAFPVNETNGTIVCGTYAINPTVTATITIEVC